MSEQNLQVNLRIPVLPGDPDRAELSSARTVLPIPEPRATTPAIGSPRYLRRRAARLRFNRTIVRELENQRGRIGRELHAGAGQPLSGIKLNLEILENCSADLPQPAREIISRLQILAEQALDQIRAVSHRLHPLEWQSHTVESALRSLVRSMSAGSRLKVDLDIQPFLFEPSQSVKVAVYRIAQECLANTIRHSGATHVRVSLHSAGLAAELVIEDNGGGFSEEARKGSGIGLRALREHAEVLGGGARISSDGRGTKVLVRIPLEGE